jgi:hypothetical protein
MSNIYEVILTPSVLSSQKEDLYLVRGSSPENAVRKLCKKANLEFETKLPSSGSRNERVKFRVTKDSGMFGGTKEHLCYASIADILE